MITYLLDSDILMDFFKKKTEVLELLDKLLGKGSIAASILSITELRAGWTDEQAAFFLPRLYQLVSIKPITREVAELAGKFRQEYKARGIIIPVIDALIGATAMVEDLWLVTRNKKDFPMPKLKFYIPV